MEESLKELWIEADHKQIPQKELDENYIIKSIHMKSKHIINRMKNKFIFDIIGPLIAIPTITYFMFMMDHVLAYIINITSLLFLGGSLLLSIRAYFILNNNLAGNLKESLLSCHMKIRTILSNQTFVVTVLSGNVVLAFLFRAIMTDRFVANDIRAWIPYLASILIVLPISYRLTKWSNQKKFGNYLQSLKRNINSLD
ncbi:hypothetical protein [Ekhidna sp.]